MAEQNKPTINVTQLLRAWRQGDEAAMQELMSVVYAELRRLAAHYLRGEHAGHTLQPTALVHEAWLRLIEIDRIEWQSRAHFFGIAATLMRRILVDHARVKRAAKRDSGGEMLSLSAAADFPAQPVLDVLALNAALTELERLDPRQGRVVELRFFAGLSVEETAEVLGISAKTVKRDWSTAKLWLARAIGNQPGESAGPTGLTGND
ncbi:MAG: sigma-70 family RNA polymerase sigma factor [Acidobacteria bacterium]|nr:sigma-70 family RNA polymerase sigma factor [Acidobacteriota bacterium]MBI3426320.1 sigma-70 family RNA polymerase sigma factor [Acidobacteriota bacterium]